MGGLSFWSRIRESNPPSRLGKPLYYRYTNPACGGIIANPIGEFKLFLTAALPVRRKGLAANLPLANRKVAMG